MYFKIPKLRTVVRYMIIINATNKYILMLH